MVDNIPGTEIPTDSTKALEALKREAKNKDASADIVRTMQWEAQHLSPADRQKFNDQLYNAFNNDPSLKHYLPEVNIVDIEQGGKQDVRDAAFQAAGGGDQPISYEAAGLKIGRNGTFTHQVNEHFTISGDENHNTTFANTGDGGKGKYELIKGPNGEIKSLKVGDGTAPQWDVRNAQVGPDGTLTYDRRGKGPDEAHPTTDHVKIGPDGRETITWDHGEKGPMGESTVIREHPGDDSPAIRVFGDTGHPTVALYNEKHEITGYATFDRALNPEQLEQLAQLAKQGKLSATEIANNPQQLKDMGLNNYFAVSDGGKTVQQLISAGTPKTGEAIHSNNLVTVGPDGRLHQDGTTYGP